MSIFPSHWGKYPAGYDREIHGFYDPAVYYGKRDTPLADVKLGELGSWLRRRNKSFSAVTGCISRAYWRHQHAWIGPKKPGVGGILHYVIALSISFYLLDYPKFQNYRNYRFH